MASTYITKDGDMLDAICLAFYGRTQNVTEWVLDQNPRLADLGPVYPVGIEIRLPELTLDILEDTTVQLWD